MKTQGQWVHVSDEDEDGWYDPTDDREAWQCSHCKALVHIDATKSPKDCGVHYCGYCFTKMATQKRWRLDENAEEVVAVVEDMEDTK